MVAVALLAVVLLPLAVHLPRRRVVEPGDAGAASVSEDGSAPEE